MHELKLLMAADEKLWQLRGSVISTAGATTASDVIANSPAALQEPSWSLQQVLCNAFVSAEAAMPNCANFDTPSISCLSLT